MEKSSYSLKLTPKASEDLDKIYSYITKELYAEESANNLIDRIETNIMRLKDFPFSCNYVDDDYLKSVPNGVVGLPPVK